MLHMNMNYVIERISVSISDLAGQRLTPTRQSPQSHLQSLPLKQQESNRLPLLCHGCICSVAAHSFHQLTKGVLVRPHLENKPYDSRKKERMSLEVAQNHKVYPSQMTRKTSLSHGRT